MKTQLVRYGGQSERDEVAAELKGSYKELAQSKYSKFLVTKLVRYCPSHRTQILAEFQGHVIRLLLHREASRSISDAFELYANAAERNMLVRDFYGKEAALFASSANEKSTGITGVLEGADDSRRKRILDALKDNLLNM